MSLKAAAASHMGVGPINSNLRSLVTLDLDVVIDDPVLRRMADCVRQLRPAIDRAVVRHGHGATLAAPSVTTPRCWRSTRSSAPSLGTHDETALPRESPGATSPLREP